MLCATHTRASVSTFSNRFHLWSTPNASDSPLAFFYANTIAIPTSTQHTLTHTRTHIHTQWDLTRCMYMLCSRRRAGEYRDPACKPCTTSVHACPCEGCLVTPLPCTSALVLSQFAPACPRSLVSAMRLLHSTAHNNLAPKNSQQRHNTGVPSLIDGLCTVFFAGIHDGAT